MTPRVRKLTLTAHVVVSVGWLGAVVVYLVLALAGRNSEDAQLVRAAYVAMELIIQNVIVPACLATVGTGLIQSLTTDWGLFRHYWILVKFLLTVGATAILLLHAPNVARMAAIAAETNLGATDHRSLRAQLVVHAAGGLIVLLAATVLSVFKPWGMTPYGRRKQQERRAEPGSAAAGSAGRYVLIAIGLLLAAFVILHLTGKGRLHG